MNDNQVRDAVIGALLLAIVLVFIQAWGLMLALGIIHADVYPPIQPIGYPVAVGLVACVNLVRSKGSATKKDD